MNCITEISCSAAKRRKDCAGVWESGFANFTNFDACSISSSVKDCKKRLVDRTREKGDL